MNNKPIENNNPIATTIFRPKDIDVLFGRGGGVYKHPGNAAFLKLVGSKKSDYLSCRKFEKPTIVKEIVECIKSEGGRFLRKGQKMRGKTTWFVVDDKKALLKTSQALRELPKKAKGSRRRSSPRRMADPPAVAGSHSSNSNSQKETAKTSSGGVSFSSKAPNQEAKPAPLIAKSISSGSNSRMVRSNTVSANLCLSFTVPNQNGSDGTGFLQNINHTNNRRPDTPRGVPRGTTDPSIGWNQTGNNVPDNSGEWKLFDFSNDNDENHPACRPTSLVRRSTPIPNLQLQTANNNLEWLLFSSSQSQGKDTSAEALEPTGHMKRTMETEQNYEAI